MMHHFAHTATSAHSATISHCRLHLAGPCMQLSHQLPPRPSLLGAETEALAALLLLGA